MKLRISPGLISCVFDILICHFFPVVRLSWHLMIGGPWANGSPPGEEGQSGEDGGVGFNGLVMMNQ